VPRVTEEYRAARRDEIVEAALEAFRRKGFHATSMADIIAQSGLSAGAIYGHFKGKSEIVLEVATRVVGERVHDVQRLGAGDRLVPPSALLKVLIDGMTRDLGDPTIVVQLWGEAITEPSLRTLARSAFQRMQAALTGYLTLWHQREHGLDHQDAAATATRQVPLFISAVQGYLLQRAIIPDFDVEAYFATLDEYLPR
jgi:AcrR family transcriptional regulator